MKSSIGDDHKETLRVEFTAEEASALGGTGSTRLTVEIDLKKLGKMYRSAISSGGKKSVEAGGALVVRVV